MFKILASILVTGVLINGLGCTKKTGLEYGLDVKETLRINIQQEPPSLDWSKSTDTTSSTITNNLMDGLTEYNLADPDLGVVAALATEWKPSANAQVWTFTLRKGVKWTDGTEFTAQHVIDGWERLLNPMTASEYAYFLFDVKGAKNYNGGKETDFSKVGIKVNADGQLIVELDKPMGYFPMLLTHHATFPIRKDLIEKHGDKWTEPGNMVTLGAFKLKVWEHDKSLVLERNDDYYGEKAKVKNVLCYMINEFSTAVNLFEAGRLDFQPELPAKELPVLKAKPEYSNNKLLSSYYYGFHTRKAPFNDLKVRKAFAHAIDRKQITDLLAADHTPMRGWIPVGMFGYEEDRGLKFDPELAKKLLDEAGYKDRSKLAKISLAFNTNENHQRVAENVQAQIKKNLGVEVQIQNEEWKVYLSRLRSDTPSIYRLGWLADYPDPSTFMSLMTTTSENNHTGWGNKKYDELVSAGGGELDKEKRRQMYSEAQKILTEDEVPVLPLFASARQYLISPRVQNFPRNSIERLLFKGVSLK